MNIEGKSCWLAHHIIIKGAVYLQMTALFWRGSRRVLIGAYPENNILPLQ